jgi:hypothetical protein
MSFESYPIAVPIPLFDNDISQKNEFNIFPVRAPSIDEKQLNTLKSKGFTHGFAESLYNNCNKIPIRFWVVDNSGSMSMTDGHRIIPQSGKSDYIRFDDCTRWDEIKECVNYHAMLAADLHLPTEFRLLNSFKRDEQFSVATTNLENVQAERSHVYRTMNAESPKGTTPLTENVVAIRSKIELIADQLRQKGQVAAVVLATDGKPTDDTGRSTNYATETFVSAMRSLESLPVWVVIRLCTDDDEVVNFYNNIDEQLELSIDVLDDFKAEAQEVYEVNPWLTYGLSLHRMRENGFHDRIFDLIDERALTKSELWQFCSLLFGKDKFDGVVDPSIDWLGFMAQVERLLQQERMTYNPIRGRPTPWLDCAKLNRLYGNASCGCSIM